MTFLCRKDFNMLIAKVYKYTKRCAEKYHEIMTFATFNKPILRELILML